MTGDFPCDHGEALSCIYTSKYVVATRSHPPREMGQLMGSFVVAIISYRPPGTVRYEPSHHMKKRKPLQHIIWMGVQVQCSECNATQVWLRSCHQAPKPPSLQVGHYDSRGHRIHVRPRFFSGVRERLRISSYRPPRPLD